MTQGALEDTFVYREFERLIKQFNISKIIETGTYQGWSTMKLAEFNIPVITIESVKSTYDIAIENFKNNKKNNIQAILGSSPEVLMEILEPSEDGVFLFLDAHWHDYWPVHDELSVCIEKKVTPVIAIHDFFVPDINGYPRFGFDRYQNQNLDLDYIKPFIDQIYGETGYEYFYNSESDAVGQGVIYIHKKI